MLIHRWENFITIHGGLEGARNVFEKAMEELLRAENQGEEVHIVKAVPGDGGIDVYVHHEDGIDIYQCKFFTGSMSKSRWSQIKYSFIKAMEPKGVKVLRWFLCMPREMRKEDIFTWDRFKKDRSSYGVEIKLVDGNEIIHRMMKCDRHSGTDLIDNYFTAPGSGVVPKCLTRFAPLGPESGLVGRDHIVDDVRAMLDDSKCIVLVSGLGGIGKTAVMQEICNNIITDGISTNHVAWITCGESLEDDLLVLRDILGVPKNYGRDDAYDAVIKELKNLDDTLYLFMDDMARMPGKEEMGILNSLRPKVRIMITSRHEIKGVPNIGLAELAQDSSIKMFYNYYGRDKEQRYKTDACVIVNSVNRHTLLVELLAKAAKRSFGPLNKFRIKLESVGFFNVYKLNLDIDHDGNTTIEECVKRLYDISDLPDQQKRIMSLFTIFTPEKEIYGEVIEWAELDGNGVNSLVDLGWLVRTEEGFVIHQIVRDSLARQVGDSLKIEEYGNLLRKAADTNNYMPRDLEYTKARERLAFAEDIAGSIERRTKALLEGGQWSDKDKELLKDSSDLVHNIAVVYQNQGDYTKALVYYGNALDIRLQVLGKEHPDIATTYNNIALVYYAQGDYTKALEYFEKAIEIAEHVLDKDHPDIATTYNNIALVYKALGDYTKAQEYFEKSLDIRKYAHGENRLDKAATYNNLAGVYEALGQYETALEFHEEVLMARRCLGVFHPDMATTYNNIGEVYRKQGMYETALGYDWIALQIIKRTLGKEHPFAATTYNNIALVYMAQRDYPKAQEYNWKALSIREQVLGKTHPLTATSYYNIARVFRKQGDYEKAMEYYEKAYSVLMEKLGKNHADTKNVQSSATLMKYLIKSGLNENQLMEMIEDSEEEHHNLNDQ